LLEILGQATNPVVIQSHLKKLFAGIHSVEFDEEQGSILAMKSLEGEVVQLKKPVPISNDVEVGGYLCVCANYCMLEEREGGRG
jgi:dynein heavy chain 2